MGHCYKHGDYTLLFCPQCEAEDDAARRAKEAARSQAEAATRVAEAHENAAKRIVEAQEEATNQIVRAQAEAAHELAQATRLATANQLERQQQIARDGWRLQADAKIQQGQRMLDAGLLDEAITLLQAGVSEDPTNFEGHIALTRVLLQQGDIEKGKRHVKTAMSLLGSDEVGKHGDFLSVLLSLPDDDDLLRDFRIRFGARIKVPRPLAADLLHALVSMLLRKGLVDEAKQLMHAQREVLPPINDEAFARLLSVLHENGLISEAEMLINSAVDPFVDESGRENLKCLRDLHQQGGAEIVDAYLNRALSLGATKGCGSFWTYALLLQHELCGGSEASEPAIRDAQRWDVSTQDAWLERLKHDWQQVSRDFSVPTIDWFRRGMDRLKTAWHAARSSRIDQWARDNVTAESLGCLGTGGIALVLAFFTPVVLIVLGIGSTSGALSLLWLAIIVVGTVGLRGVINNARKNKIVVAKRQELEIGEKGMWPSGIADSGAV